FMTTFVRRDEGSGKNSIRTFHLLFAAAVAFSAIAYVGLVSLGPVTIPILLGKKALAIVPYLATYGLAIVWFTLANTIISYHLAKRNYIFSLAAVAMAVGLSGGIILFHKNIFQ